MKFNREELEAVTRLLQNKDFKTFLEGMARDFEKQNKHLIMGMFTADELINKQGQLKSSVLLLEAINNAPSEYSKLAQPQT